MSVNLPAFCDNKECGAIFPSGFAFENAVNITLSGNKSGPCPHCGGHGSIPDGVFNFVNDTIQILSAPQRTIDEFNRLSAIIIEAIKNKNSAQDIAKKINKEIPDLTRLGKTILTIGGGLLLFLQIINTIIDIQKSVQGTQPYNTINQNITINQIFDNLYQEQNNKIMINIDCNSKVGRNDKCHCGSGIKYKKCCGK